jgi:hypothetical protein
MVSSKNTFALNWRSHTESHETIVAQLLEQKWAEWYPTTLVSLVTLP